MTRHMWFVLLLAAGVVLADDKARAERAADAQVPAEAAPGQAHAGQVKTEAAQGQTGEAQGKAGAGPEQAEEAPARTEDDAKLTSVPGGKALGMSILGNQDAPKSLVIVPWKSSELGGSPGVSLLLDDSRQPVDKDVFMRSLLYHEIRSGATRHDGATAGGGENPAAESGAAQSAAARRR